MRVFWSRHSDLNRGPAVYELRGPRHVTRLCNVLHRPLARHLGRPVFDQKLLIVACTTSGGGYADAVRGVITRARPTLPANPVSVGVLATRPAQGSGPVLRVSANESICGSPSHLANVDPGLVPVRRRTTYRGVVGDTRGWCRWRSTGKLFRPGVRRPWWHRRPRDDSVGRGHTRAVARFGRELGNDHGTNC